jgi:hypothetical protein
MACDIRFCAGEANAILVDQISGCQKERVSRGDIGSVEFMVSFSLCSVELHNEGRYIDIEEVSLDLTSKTVNYCT